MKVPCDILKQKRKQSSLSSGLSEFFSCDGVYLTSQLFQLQQKLVVQIDMHDARSRSKAMKIAVGLPGRLNSYIAV